MERADRPVRTAEAKECEVGFLCPYRVKDLRLKKCPVVGLGLSQDQAIEVCIKDEMKPSFRERVGMVKKLPPQE